MRDYFEIDIIRDDNHDGGVGRCCESARVTFFCRVTCYAHEFVSESGVSRVGRHRDREEGGRRA